MSYALPDHWRSLRVVLAHDWLTGMRGGERCLQLLCEGMPEAAIYTLVHQPERVSDTINRHPIHTSVLQKIPFVRRRFRGLLPFFPRLIESMRAAPAELLVSTSHCVAKGLVPPPGARHLCYCFTPMRYGIFYSQYFGRNPVKEMVVHPVLARLRAWDCRASERVDRFVAVSRHVRRRIKYFYGREADVVYPPVDLEAFAGQGGGEGAYDLVVSALVPYKQVGLAVEAYTRLGRPLKVVGTGGEYRRLRREAGPNVEFLGWQSDEAVRALYGDCRFVIFPGEEDFGIVPVEAQACGKPVIAFGRGGALESVAAGETGVFFRRQTAEDLLGAVEEAAALRRDPDRIRGNAQPFGIQAFLDGLDRSLRACLGGETAAEKGERS